MRKQTRFSLLARAAVSTPTGTAFRCCYCGAVVPLSVVDLDHVTAKARGGRDAASNRVVACVACNSRKSSKPLRVFARELVTARAWALAGKAPSGTPFSEVEEIFVQTREELAEEIVKRVRAEAARRPVTWLGRYWAAAYYTARGTKVVDLAQEERS